ncbi:MAG TPA: hypothetical protein VHP55_03690 [Usitatibacter sp.]|jgi:hypothetical protein|nr:hypothetical protein [Usitatibacter sp.]
MRASIVRQALATVVVLVAIGMALTWVGGGRDLATGQLGWAVVLAVGIAAATAWQRLAKVKRGFVAATNPDFALVPVDPRQWPRIDWRALDDLAVQLESHGYRRLGDFTTNRQPGPARGMARFLGDPEETQVVELQQFERTGAARRPDDELVKVHVAIGSVLGGRAKAMVSDRPIQPASYLIRNENAALASYPGKSALELTELQRRLAAQLAGKSGLPVDTGYTLERYVLLERERQRELRARLERRGAWEMLGEYERFAANPLAAYAPREEHLKALRPRPWSALESGDAAPAIGKPAAPAAAHAVPDVLRARMASGAQWFYWIAALSAANALSAAFGSRWGFVIGLGISQALNVAAGMTATAVGHAIVWSLNAASIAVFALLGWLAQRPSIAAFSIGITLFALDTLIFLLARDWIGVAFHALALYFLWKGLAAAREMKRLASAADPAPAPVS